MNNNTKNSDSDIPEEVLELIPWYAIGKLSVDDQARFEEALVVHPSLQAQIDFEQQMIEKVSADTSILDKSVIAPTEERLKSVLNMIDIEEAQTQSKPIISSSNTISDKFKSFLDVLLPSANGVPQYARIASVGVLVLSVAALTAFIAPLFNDESEFTPASSVTTANETQSSSTAVSQTTLLVGFNGSLIELGENSVLIGKLMKVESIPEKEGMFKISFNQKMSAEEIKQTIDALLAQKDLIWFAGEAF